MISRLQIEQKQISALDGETTKQGQESDTRKHRGFLRLPEVLKIIPISKSTWWKGIKDGRFPKPVKLTERTSAWLLEDIEALCAKFVASGVEGGSH